jgi:hypothetical protein
MIESLKKLQIIIRDIKVTQQEMRDPSNITSTDPKE